MNEDKIDRMFGIAFCLVLFIFLSSLLFVFVKERQYKIEQKTMEYESKIASLYNEVESIKIDNEYYDMGVCSDGVFKSYEPYTAITDKTSKQYHLQQMAYTDENGLRKFNDYYLIAIGDYYSQSVGDIFVIEFEDGSKISAMVGDLKKTHHTDENGCAMNSDNSVLEFIVDTKKLDKTVKRLGDLNYLFTGKIVSIRKFIAG